MKATKNLELNRYEWAVETINARVTAAGSTVPLTVFDVGSGDGTLKQQLGNLQVNLVSFDLFPASAEVHAWDLDTPFNYPGPKADMITLLEVTEHLNNPWLSMKNLSGALKPGGLLLLTTPNPAWSDSRIHTLMKGFPSCFTQADLDLNHHVFTAWPHIMERLLTDNNFRILGFYTLDGSTHLFGKPFWGTRLPARLLFRLLKKWIEKTDRNACGMSYALLAQKNADETA